MAQDPPRGHIEAQRYVREVLGTKEEDLPASERLEVPTEKLDALDESFFSRALETLIASGGDRLLQELDLVDDDSGARFKIRLEILKVPKDVFKEDMN
jgi:hypothetical protein